MARILLIHWWRNVKFVHQLFYHRLTKGRLDDFYGSRATITLPGVGRLPLAEIRQMRWAINGVVYKDTLDDVIARAIDLLETLCLCTFVVKVDVRINQIGPIFE